MTDVGEEIVNSAIKGIKPQGKPWTQNERLITPPQAAGVLKNIIKAGVLYAERDNNMIEYYATNPGHSKKRFANPKRILYRKRYGRPVPDVT